jgi:hypothetical protein
MLAFEGYGAKTLQETHFFLESRDGMNRVRENRGKKPQIPPLRCAPVATTPKNLNPNNQLQGVPTT